MLKNSPNPEFYDSNFHCQSLLCNFSVFLQFSHHCKLLKASLYIQQVSFSPFSFSKTDFSNFQEGLFTLVPSKLCCELKKVPLRINIFPSWLDEKFSHRVCFDVKQGWENNNNIPLLPDFITQDSTSFCSENSFPYDFLRPSKFSETLHLLTDAIGLIFPSRLERYLISLEVIDISHMARFTSVIAIFMSYCQ